jgi:hypothetical protein
MTLYQQIPTFYRVTWNLTSPTNYSSTSGIIPFNSVQMINTVAVTNSNSSPTFQNGDTILCNDCIVGPFSNTSVISNVVTAFNNVSQFTGVMAQQMFTGYITLQSIDPTHQMIALNDYVGTPLEELGLTYAANFKYGNPIYGGAFGSITNGNNVVINGTTVNFTGGTQSGVITNINSYKGSTNVLATPCAGNIQLNSLDGSPILFGTGSSGTSAALGFSDGSYTGGALTYTQALLIEQANMMWNAIITQVETILSPIYWGSLYIQGGNTTDGSSIPTQVSWTIGITNPNILTTVTLSGEPEGAGVTLTGINALVRLMCRGLAGTYNENRKVYNNTLTVRNGFASRENPVMVQNLTAYPIDTTANLNILANNFTVTQIGNA